MAIFSLFSVLTSILSGVISIITGVLFTKARDFLAIIKTTERTQHDQFRIDSIAKLCNLIGILTIIYGSMRILSSLLSSSNFLRHLF